MVKLCACGCGNVLKNNENTFINVHNLELYETPTSYAEITF
jgi:hypothetical protein